MNDGGMGGGSVVDHSVHEDKPEKPQIEKPSEERVQEHEQLTERRIQSYINDTRMMGQPPDPNVISGIRARHEACKANAAKCT